MNANPGEELRITFEMKGDIDQPASGMYRAMVRQDEPDVWQVQAGAGTWQVSESLALAWAGPPDPQVIRVYHRALYPESERDRRSIYRFQLWAKNGSGAEVTSLAQPLRLRWQVGERLAGRPNIAPVLRLWNPVAQRWEHVASCLHVAASYFDAAYEYDVADNLRFVRDRNLITTEMEYDALGRKTAMTDPDMGAWSYAYDDAGNLIRQTDARQQTICFYYDALGRLLGKSYRNDTACPATEPALSGDRRSQAEGASVFAITYTYDEAGHGSSAGRRTGMVDASGSTAWSYDQRGRVIGETKTIDGMAYTTASSYDAMNRLKVLTYPDAAAEQVSHSYNPQGLLESVTGLKPYVLSSSYDEASRLTGQVLQNNDGQSWTTVYSYYAWGDPNLGRLQALTTTGTGASGAETFQDLSYGYDAVGNVLSIVDGVAGQTQSFGYDDLGRLASASAGGSEGAYAEAYQYYRGGSLQRKGDPNNANDGLYAYDDGNHVHAATSHRGNSYGYDANGNMTDRVVDDVSYTLAYDEENRLISVTGGITVTFTYDGDGKRVKKEVDGVVTHYPNRYYESTLGSGSTKYFYADGQLVSFERSPEYGDAYGRRYVFRDHLGSTSIIANGSGVRIWEDRYLPFGDVHYHSDTVTNTVQTRQRYTGQWLEEGLAASQENGLDRGLYDYGARWYDASLGRFVQADTIVPEPGNPQSLNRYSSVLNNPLRYIDPSGHDPLDQAWQDEFEQIHHRKPTAEDIQIRLFSIAFPNEWNWSAFYNPDGSYIQGSLEIVFRDQRPANWSWEDMPGALERMAGWYKAGEEEFYTRDIGSLFAGLLNRFEAPEAWRSVYNGGRGSARVWVYLDPEGLDPVLSGASYEGHDRDSNVHHWAWALTMGGSYGALVGIGVNTVREVDQFERNWAALASDVWLGNRGAFLGEHFRVIGIRDISQVWNRYMVR